MPCQEDGLHEIETRKLFPRIGPGCGGEALRGTFPNYFGQSPPGGPGKHDPRARGCPEMRRPFLRLRVVELYGESHHHHHHQPIATRSGFDGPLLLGGINDGAWWFYRESSLLTGGRFALEEASLVLFHESAVSCKVLLFICTALEGSAKKWII